MLKIAICDDEMDYRKYVVMTIEKIFKERHIYIDILEFGGGCELVDKINLETYFDIIFLDIEMPDKQGMEVAKSIREKYRDTTIVFITAFDNYVFEAFDYDAAAYIRKSEFDKNIEKVIDRILLKIDIRDVQVTFKNQEGQYRISPKDIMYFESIDHSIYIHDKENRVIKITYSLSQLEKEFSEYNFFRIHSGYLVNLKYVYSIDNTSLILTNKKSLPISRHRIKETKKVFHKILRGGVIDKWIICILPLKSLLHFLNRQ